MQNPDQEAFRERAAALGLALTPGQFEGLERYLALLLEWNARLNLTAIREPAAIREQHFLDALAALARLPDRFRPPFRAIDVGSGAGLPGLPLAIVRPECSFTLLEATGRKAAFLRAVIGALGLANVRVVVGRAETAAHEPAHREAYDLALARAVAPLPTLAEFCLPFVRPGGALVAWKGPEAERELAAAGAALALLGGTARPTVPLGLGGRLSGHRLVVIDKAAPTPARYPRRPGMPAKRPL